ncbi:hypothetical protein XELAEV_18024265mg [Xenopus laevis]|uniref:Glucagon / GIP / secretin / VIP family domain-containing protein n=1 Tax=Xenopus laevis TaxID=8355 RepID=A0A974CYK1_XENLA|nr:hypothetical protein XELAEV_18024265mg [Xenopus laevis]
MAGSLVRLGQVVLLLSSLIPSSTSLPALERRVQRHSDGLLTNLYSRARSQISAKHHLNTLIYSKRSDSESAFLNELVENDRDLEDLCFSELYQNFLNESQSAEDALESAQRMYKLICPVFIQLIVDQN